VAQGTAQEDKSSSRINQTSYVENCETSAVGRALAMLGIGIETSIASSNEVSMAIAKQEGTPTTKKADPKKSTAQKATDISVLFSRAEDFLKKNPTEANLIKVLEQTYPFCSAVPKTSSRRTQQKQTSSRCWQSTRVSSAWNRQLCLVTS
jgi:hypothetical protein